MNPNPNLITESGREHLSRADRAGLLEADALDLQMHAPKYNGRNGHQVHQFNQLLGNVRGCILDCRMPDEKWTKSWAAGRMGDDSAGSNLSKTECRVLAWRRGGVEEYDRVTRLAYPRVITVTEER